MSNWKVLDVVLIGLAVVLCAFRIIGHKSQTFQAAAHLEVGILIGLAIGSENRRVYIVTAAVMSAVEVLMFLATRP